MFFKNASAPYHNYCLLDKINFEPTFVEKIDNKKIQ
jgi:hypothetical protein